MKAKNDLIQKEKDILKQENEVLKTKEQEWKTKENELNSKVQVILFFLFLDRAFASFLASCTVLESEGGGITDCDEEVGMIEEDDSRGVTIFLEGASVHVE
ncbi:hypothetical protein TNCV_379621 [Trichonephila clavipes]|nr:hypothetical protein TNCV_379621 [Trichonephila clavipes]